MKKKVIGILRWGFIIFIAMLVAIIIKIFIIEVYKIPSSSMEPTLLTGDYIVIQKLSYGARLLRMKKLLKEKKQDYIRVNGFGEIEKNDVIVFNFPNYESFKDENPNIFGNFDMVKRCYGMPGDSVLVKNIRMKNENLFEQKPDLFPQDSTIKWTVDNFGPVYVPKKGATIQLNRKNVILYGRLMIFEELTIKINDSIVLRNNKPIHSYTFRENYYFMKGDNFYWSIDSRYLGFVPECNIIGKAIIVVCSSNQDTKWYNSFRWKRILRIIK